MLYLVLILVSSVNSPETTIVDNVPIVELIKLQNGPWVTTYYVFWDFSKPRCIVDVKHSRDIQYLHVEEGKVHFLDTETNCRRIIHFNIYIETHTTVDVDRVEKYMGWEVPRTKLTPPKIHKGANYIELSL